jgi:hypothetical protein
MSVIATNQVIVTSAGSKIVAAAAEGQQLLVTNQDATNSVYFGGPGVTTSTGAQIKPGQQLTGSFVDLPAETEAWLISATGQTPRADVVQVQA